jgi:hypothetical protein
MIEDTAKPATTNMKNKCRRTNDLSNVFTTLFVLYCEKKVTELDRRLNNMPKGLGGFVAGGIATASDDDDDDAAAG